jgi:uncharacterized membrane protein
MMHWWYDDGHMAWMSVWWTLGAAFFLALLVWTLVVTTRGPPGHAADSAESILKRRYASGEIDRVTFQRMLDDLRGGGGPGRPIAES